MVLTYNSLFKKEDLGEYGDYKITQYVNDGETFYYNVRLIKMSLPWKCFGVTHESWKCGKPGENRSAVFPEMSKIWIVDIDDGGCKKNKFERDIKMLLDALETENEIEMKSRYHFYLGQSYMCIGKFEESIDHYKKRLSYGGWDEEEWLSMYMIVKNYYFLKNYEEMEKWAIKAYEMRPIRADQLAVICDAFLRIKDYDKARKYMELGIKIPLPAREMLYVSKKIYSTFFHYIHFELELINDPSNNKKLLKMLLELFDKERECDRNNVVININRFMYNIPCESEWNLGYDNVHSLSIFNHNNQPHLLVDDTVVLDGKLKKLSIGTRKNINVFNENIYYCTFSDTQMYEIGSIEDTLLVPKKTSDQKFIPFDNGNVVSFYPFKTSCGICFDKLPKILSKFDTNIPGIIYEKCTWFILSCDIISSDMQITSTALMFLVLGENDLPKYYSIPFYVGAKNIKKVMSFYINDDNSGVLIFLEGEISKGVIFNMEKIKNILLEC